MGNIVEEIKGPRTMIDFLVREIVFNDCYCLKRIEDKSFDCIIDIGANVGIFSMTCEEFMPPNKNIIALEPVKSTYDLLMENLLRHVPFSIGIQKGIGEGKPLYVQLQKDHVVNPGGNQCIEEDNGGEKIETVTLKDIFEQYHIPKDCRYLIKFDCEGGEKYFNHHDNWEYLINAAVITGEIHFNTPEKYFNNHVPDKAYLEFLFKRLEYFMDIKDLNWQMKFPGGSVGNNSGNIFAVKK